MKKVLVVMPNLSSGGAEKSLINLLNSIDPTQYQIDLLLFQQKGIFLSQVPQYVKIIDTPNTLKVTFQKGGGDIPMGAFLAYLNRYVGTGISKLISPKCWNRGRQIRWKYFYKHSIKKLEKSYDIAISYLEGECMYYVVDKVKASKKMGWFHNDYRATHYDVKLDYEYFEKLDQVITISEECARILKQSFATLKDRILCLPNITSSEMVWSMASCFAPPEYKKDRINLLSIGRLNRQKAFDRAIRAAKILKDNQLNVRWVILGAGEQRDELMALVSSFGLNEQVILAGVKENPYPYIKQCDMVVQTSIYEGKSIVLDEAKILRRPIVVTDYATVGDQVISGKEGIIVSQTPEAIAQGILALHNDTKLYQNIVTYLSEHEYGNQDLVLLYEELMNA